MKIVTRYLTLGLLLNIFATACTFQQYLVNDTEFLQTNNNSPPPEVELRDRGPAPELVNDVWLNTDRPLRLADLRGNVVLLNFWTFG
jgi:hypothetical protein